MSDRGQSLLKWDVPATSAFPLLATEERTSGNVSNVPGSDMAPAPKARLDEAQRPRSITTFVSTQMAAAASKKAPPNATRTSPGQFDLMPKPLPGPSGPACHARSEAA